MQGARPGQESTIRRGPLIAIGGIALIVAGCVADSHPNPLVHDSETFAGSPLPWQSPPRPGPTAGTPRIRQVAVEGRKVSLAGPIVVRPGERIDLEGSGFGAGPDVDYSKVTVGGVRALERALPFYEPAMDLTERVYAEKAKLAAVLPRDLLEWSETHIALRVPAAAATGDLVVSVQQRRSNIPDLRDPSRPHIVRDPLSERVQDRTFPPRTGAVARLGPIKTSSPLRIALAADHAALVRDGARIFWGCDFNTGQAHAYQGLDWASILGGRAIDPLTGWPADPRRFGAIRARPGDVVEAAARTPIHFAPSPMHSPIRPLLLLDQPDAVSSIPTGWYGWVACDSRDVYTGRRVRRVGFGCASCHARAIEYDGPDGPVRRIVPGIPNVRWNMTWALLSAGFDGVKCKEADESGRIEEVDKTWIIAAVPDGCGEHTLIRRSQRTAPFSNDNYFSPIAIPVIVHTTPLRRVLSRSELVAGFEGSYIHAQEPDGGLGAMNPRSLIALTAYMADLDRQTADLRPLGLYRALAERHRLADVDAAPLAQFLRRGPAAYPQLRRRLARGWAAFAARCSRCHAENQGTYTNEDMIPFQDVGLFYSPTLWNAELQAVRTAPLNLVYWTQDRGLLHDGHIRSVEDLVNPERGRPGTALYRRYYTIHPGSPRIRLGSTPAQRTAVRRVHYLAAVSWDPDHLYWDYQTFRRRFGIAEYGLRRPVPLPEVPHPWFAASAAEVDDLVLYLFSL